MTWLDYREVRERVRIVDLLEELGWQATKTRGAQLRGSCPLPGCESTRTGGKPSPSQQTFSVQRDRNIYRCFRCGSAGSVIDFWSAYRRLTIYEVAKELSSKINGHQRSQTSNSTDGINDPQKQQQGGVGTVAQSGEAVAFDAGLRSHMLKVYNYMASGVLWTGIVALLFAQTQLAQNLMTNPGLLGWIIMLSPLAFILVLSFGVHKLSETALQACFWGFATVMGLSMARIFMMFSGESIAQTFFATAAAFAGLSLWAYTTNKDLSGWARFLIMGVVGLLVASIANIWLQSGTMHWVISFAGVLIFAGLTAYDTERIKSEYFHLRGNDFIWPAAVMGALNLYLDFVNMFQFLLSFMGSND